jgi:Trk K+ transport system NAD-binding subunit
MSFRDSGDPVVIIEREPTPYLLDECRMRNIPLLRGDATDPHMFNSAGIYRARYLVAVCGDDAVNADVGL